MRSVDVQREIERRPDVFVSRFKNAVRVTKDIGPNLGKHYQIRFNTLVFGRPTDEEIAVAMEECYRMLLAEESPVVASEEEILKGESK